MFICLYVFLLCSRACPKVFVLGVHPTFVMNYVTASQLVNPNLTPGLSLTWIHMKIVARSFWNSPSYTAWKKHLKFPDMTPCNFNFRVLAGLCFWASWCFYKFLPLTSRVSQHTVSVWPNMFEVFEISTKGFQIWIFLCQVVSSCIPFVNQIVNFMALSMFQNPPKSMSLLMVNPPKSMALSMKASSESMSLSREVHLLVNS